jgi:ubiquinone/menaquinone biosynthesis C-methylase UbiE
MAHDPSLKSSFNDVARLYDQTRPGYPEALIEDAIRLSGIPSGGRILEIGCGPGKATLPFARRGYRML